MNRMRKAGYNHLPACIQIQACSLTMVEEACKKEGGGGSVPNKNVFICINNIHSLFTEKLGGTGPMDS